MSVAAVDSIVPVPSATVQTRSGYESVAMARGMQEHGRAGRETEVRPAASASGSVSVGTTASSGSNGTGVQSPASVPSARQESTRQAADRREAERREADESERVESAVNQANETMAMRNRSIRFRVHSDTGKIQIQVVDPVKDKILLNIPSDDMLTLATRMRELSSRALGAVVDLSK